MPACCVSQCLNQAVRGGLVGFCRAHGGGARCEVCQCPASSRNLCKKHGGGHRCSVEGCSMSAAYPSVDRCTQHGGGIRCCITNCNNPASYKDRTKKSKNRCKFHLQGNVSPPRQPRIESKLSSESEEIITLHPSRARAPRSSETKGIAEGMRCLSPSKLPLEERTGHTDIVHCRGSSEILNIDHECETFDLIEFPQESIEMNKVMAMTPLNDSANLTFDSSPGCHYRTAVIHVSSRDPRELDQSPLTVLANSIVCHLDASTIQEQPI